MRTALEMVLFFGTLLAAAWFLSAWMVRVYEGRPGVLGTVLGPVERLTYRALRVDPAHEQDWKGYARSLLSFTGVSVLVLYLLLRLQGHLPLNPDGMSGVRPDIAFNTAWSFVTNTNWQNYAGENTMSYLSQMVGLTFQNFVSAAVGIAVAIALVRGFARSGTGTIGNFWADLVRGLYYLLLPLALALAVVLVSRGVVMTFDGSVTAHTLEGATQTIARGPAASQVAIKHLGTNGGGFFNANSAHPFENPTPLTNTLELWSELLIPFALPFVFGRMVRARRQGVALFAAMAILFTAALCVAIPAENRSTPALRGAGLPASVVNTEGKEQRISVPEAATFAVGTTMTSTGAVDGMHDSYTAVSGGALMAGMMLGEVSPGGVGSGLYTMLLFAVIAVFIAGLMIGRTPEYLGKRIRAREVKLSMLAVLVMPVGVLITVGLSVVLHAGLAGPLNAGPHGFSEILYALTSQWNNNGSAFGGLTGATDYYDVVGGIGMALGRFLIIVPILALAGALAGQRTRPVGPGTMPTASPIFVGLLVGTVLLVGALNFFPALALGPIAEALTGRLF
ncbi:MAG: potassium-transporting ATPase subunit KdpA [Thermoleophilia bacterium]